MSASRFYLGILGLMAIGYAAGGVVGVILQELIP